MEISKRDPVFLTAKMWYFLFLIVRVERKIFKPWSLQMHQCFEIWFFKAKNFLMDFLNWSSYIEWFVDANKFVIISEEGT